GVARNLRARLVRFRHRVSAMCASMWQGAQACPSVRDSNWGPPRRFRELSFDHPAGKMLPRDVGQGTNPVVALVEAGQEVEFPASRSEEDFSALDADFFERLQAIPDETRTDHVHAPHTAPAVVGQGERGIGLYPFRPSKAGLEGDLPLSLGKFESLGKEARGLLTLEM